MKFINTCQVPLNFFKNPLNLLATGFGIGLSPIIPGTLGTLATIPLYLLLSHLPVIYYIIITLAITTISILLCDKVAKDLKINDPQCIILDESVGFLFTMTGAPIGVMWVIIGFLGFRIFDMIKPWPISWIDQKIHGGFGIVFDDVAAAIPAAILLHVVKYLFT